MTYKYLAYSIALGFISFIVGMAVNAILRRTVFYTHSLSNLNFIRSEQLNRLIGIGVFKWVIKNTFLKYFNQSLTLKKKIEKTDLVKLRDEMTAAEISHLIAFLFVTTFALEKFYNLNFIFGLTIMIVNVLMNLYPSLLQQVNKRRIDKFITLTLRQIR